MSIYFTAENAGFLLLRENLFQDCGEFWDPLPAPTSLHWLIKQGGQSLFQRDQIQILGTKGAEDWGLF